MASIWLLARTVESLIRPVREATLLTVPLASSQPVAFRNPVSWTSTWRWERGTNLPRRRLNRGLDSPSDPAVEMWNWPSR